MPDFRPPLVVFLICSAVAALPADAATPTMREARFDVELTPAGCSVNSRFAVAAAEPLLVEHRLMLAEGVPLPRFTVLGAIAENADVVGRTARLPISLTGLGRNEYAVRYAVTAANGRIERCPLLVPSAPADGVNRAVTIAVSLPPGGMRLPGEFPILDWSSGRGHLALANVPAFVLVPHAAAGAQVTWRDTLDTRRILDIAALAVIAASTRAWAALRKRIA